jgi:hypothetical protein
MDFTILLHDKMDPCFVLSLVVTIAQSVLNWNNELGQRRNLGSIPGSGDFPHLCDIQTGSRIVPAFYLMATGSNIPGGKATGA